MAICSRLAASIQQVADGTVHVPWLGLCNRYVPAGQPGSCMSAVLEKMTWLQLCRHGRLQKPLQHIFREARASSLPCPSPAEGHRLRLQTPCTSERSWQSCRGAMRSLLLRGMPLPSLHMCAGCWRLCDGCCRRRLSSMLLRCCRPASWLHAIGMPPRSPPSCWQYLYAAGSCAKRTNNSAYLALHLCSIAILGVAPSAVVSGVPSACTAFTARTAMPPGPCKYVAAANS